MVKDVGRQAVGDAPQDDTWLAHGGQGGSWKEGNTHLGLRMGSRILSIMNGEEGNSLFCEVCSLRRHASTCSKVGGYMPQ